MSLIFILIAALLVAGVVLPLGLVLWRSPQSDSNVEHQAVNAAVLRDQLLELEHDRLSGTLSVRDHAEARQELQRRVLEEVEPGRTGTWAGQGGKYAAIALSIVLPLAAALTYLAIGNPAAIVPTALQSPASVTQADVQAMVDSLAARLARNPDDPAGWLMLARSYRHFERYEDAANAFGKAGAAIETDPLVLSEYAETLARSSREGFKGKPTQLLGQALSLNPKEPFALTLAGAAALERRDYEAAVQYWQQLLELLPPDSDASRAVANSIERARREQVQPASQ
ncbi:c-type cytochrome biogenesis protein CcmI [Paracandidimonas lactea]|uniref:c-type cytochrome biogenesis protein CcmI n=1 Tax=Paracandidimonas lactea TaxID=2895524 RepID=UPI001F019FBC|nr:c-type cytochrome biogenesis protein CcmI [Paracandidimonas lactea]